VLEANSVVIGIAGEVERAQPRTRRHQP
jgi:hypothetical protein